MTNAIPWVFASLAALMLGVGVVGFWQSVRAALGLVDDASARSEGSGDADEALFARKRAALEGLRELDFDREAGKLSDEDHARERDRLRAEARAALKAIDDELGPYRADAEARVAARLANVTPTGAPKAPREPEEAPESKPDSPTPPVASATFQKRVKCASCETENEADATFCKRCGAKVEGGTP